MPVRILYFAAAREAAGTSGEELAAPGFESVAALRRALAARHPGLADVLVSRTTSLEEGAAITTTMAAEGPGDIVKLVMVP